MHIKSKMNRILSLLLTVVTLFSLAATPAMAAVVPSQNKSLGDGSSNVTIKQGSYIKILGKSTGGTVGGSGWTYTSNDGITGPAYCVNWGLNAVSPSKKLEITGRYDRSPKTMGAFANGYPQRTLAQFKELHPGIQGIEKLTESEYAYATQLAIWATCGQLAVPGTAFSSGRASLVKPTSDAQQIRVYESVTEILRLANTWSKQIYSGLYFHMDKDKLGTSLTIYDDYGLEGAASKGTGGIKKEVINGKEYYTRLMYVDSATSTYPNDYEIYVYAMDAPAGTIMTDANNQVYPSRQQWGATMYEVPTPKDEPTSLNANGSAYTGAFKLCIPVNSVTDSGAITVQAYAVITQFNLYLANNPTATEQSYIIADPAYVGRFAKADIKWSSAERPDTASLLVQKVDGSAMPLEGAEFTLTGSKGTTRTGISDENGKMEWTELPADETFVLTETKAPAGFSVVAPRNISLTAGQTSHVTIQDDTSKHFIVKKIDKQNKAALQGAVFRFEQIDGSYVTTATTGFDGMLEFAGDELPYGSYRVSEQAPPSTYLKDDRIETVEWTGEKDILLTFENVREPQLILVKKNENGISLSGATFDIYGDGKYLTSVTTNEAGEAYITGIKAEMYVEAVEKIAPEGHVLDRTSHGIHIDPYDPAIEDDPVLTVVNQSRPSLRIIKYDRQSGQRLPNVTFEIYKDAELFDTVTTPESGEVCLYDLLPGTYLVKEVSSDDSHIVCTTPQQIELKAGQTATQELVFFNDLKPGMHLIKVDSADLSKPIANARFRFEAVDGSWGPEELTTLEDGTIDLSKLPTGAAVVTELDCPGYVIDDAQRIIELKPNETAQFVFTNSKKPSLKLTKTSSDGTPLEGVSFRLAKIEDGSHYLDRTTSVSGEILWEGLDPGVYSLVETSTLNDHILDLKEHHVELFPGKVSEIVLENHKRPNLYVYKNDADDGTPIEHTIFTVRAADGHSVDEIETDSTGRAVLENMLPGVYEISEKSVPSPWLKDAPSQLVTLYPDRDHTAYFKNHKRPVIEIIKENAVTFERLAHVPFQVWYASNNTSTGEFNDLGVFYTDENGRIELNGPEMGELGLRDGWFRVQELEPLTGFAKADPDTQEAFVPAGQGHTFRFQNQPLSAICVWKYDSQHPNVAIEGAVFQIRYLSGNTSGTGGTVIGTYRTSSNGSFTATGLPKGTFIIEELSSDGSHVIDTPPQTVYLSGEQQEVVQVYFGNSAKGSLLVTKVDDEGKPLSGVEFLVTKSDGTLVGDANGKFTTALDGTFLVQDVDPNTTLIVKETKQKTGYVLDEVAQTAMIKAGQCVKLQFVNHKAGNLVIHKLSSLDRTPLEGAQFKLTYADGRVVDTADGKLSSNGLYFSNSEGQIIIPNVTGTIIATEVASIEGFAIDPNTRSQTVVINPGSDTQHLYFYNTPLCSLTLSKLDSVSGKPIPNTTFSVKDGNGNLIGRYTTGQDGTVTVSGLLPGSTVVVSEYKVPDTHVLNPMPQTITLKSGKNTVTSGATGGSGTGGNGSSSGGNDLVFENDPKMTLTIKKYIKGTNYEPLAGVCFKIVDGAGKPVGSGDGTFYTNSAGEIVVEGLEPGTTVTAREISTVDGFVLDGEPKSVQIKASNKAPELVFWNEKAGSLVIQKKSSLDGSPLAGAQFLLTYADGSYVDADNGHMSSKGLYTTDKNGEIRITGITGTVIAKEIKSIPGYVIDPATQTQTVKINPDDCQTLVFYNTPVGNFELIKVSESDTTKRIPNVTFEIRRASDGGLVDTITTGRDGRATLQLDAGNFYAVETACPKEFKLDSTPHYFTMKEDGTGTTLTVTNKAFSGILLHKINSKTKAGIPNVTFLLYDGKMNPVEQFTTDQRGYAYIDTLDLSGKVYLRELNNDGYVRDDQLKTVYVKPGETTEIVWENTPITGQIQIWKKSADDNPINGFPAGTPLEGAVFEIYDKANNLVDTVKSNSRGLAVSKQLPLSRYTVKEVTAPAYYSVNSEAVTVYLEHEGQIVQIEVLDKSVYTNVSVQKSGYTQVVPGQSIRYTFKEIGNNSTVALDNFYWRDTLPTDAVRLDKIITGTWSAKLNYKVVFKTNTNSDYRTLADNLNTQRNYTLDASAAALGLASNEYVTEVTFLFGRVPGGFKQMQTPYIYCNTLSTLSHEYRFTNKTDVGGIWQGQWVMANDRWVTIVYRGGPKPTLPRTGY